MFENHRGSQALVDIYIANILIIISASVVMSNPIQNFNAAIDGLSKEVKYQQQELAYFKEKIQNLMPWAKEFYIHE